MMKRRTTLFAGGVIAGVLAAVSVTLIAGQVAVPFTFAANTLALASEVNANFNAIATEVNDNAARIAASVSCPANTPTRFTDLGDGTVCDSQTGLMWEKKTGTVSTDVNCGVGCPDPHDVNNTYTWTENVAPFTEPTGTLYANFLAKLNDLEFPNDGTATPCFAGHCDWRVPTIGELRSILAAPAPNCTDPCIAAGFPGPTNLADYWSSTTNVAVSTEALDVGNNGQINHDPKTGDGHVRAVRGGR